MRRSFVWGLTGLLASVMAATFIVPHLSTTAQGNSPEYPPTSMSKAAKQNSPGTAPLFHPRSVYVPNRFKLQYLAQGVNYGLPYDYHYLMGTPPFAGLHVIRILPQAETMNTLLNGYPLGRLKSSLLSRYQIVDEWEAAIGGHSLRIAIFKERQHPKMLVIDQYDGRIRNVIPVSRATLTLINFTGFYVVFVAGTWTPDGKEPIQAFNVLNGKITTAGFTRFITGCFPCNATPIYIQGLGRRYSNTPV